METITVTNKVFGDKLLQHLNAKKQYIAEEQKKFKLSQKKSK